MEVELLRDAILWLTNGDHELLGYELDTNEPS